MRQESNNDVIKQTLGIWNKMVKEYKMEGDAKILTWPALDHKFKPGTNDIGFRQWWDKGITAICSLHSHREGTSKVLNNYKRNLT